MKRFACHRVYKTPDIFQGQSVIEINDKGDVITCSLLNNETNYTEWIGGVVVLSSDDELFLENNFKYFLQKNCSQDQGNPVFAWHISPCDFEKEDYLPISRLKRLH